MNGYHSLLEIDALTAGGVPETLRFCCTAGFSGGGHTWHPYIVDPGLIQINLFASGKISGPSSYSYGEIIIGNKKAPEDLTGPTDWLKGYQFYGRPVRRYYGLVTAPFPSGYSLSVANIQNVDPLWDKFSFTLRGRQAELDTPLNTLRFLGNNVAPDGLEGDASLKDTLKPLLLGRVGREQAFKPVLCNSSKLIYAVSPATGLAVDEMGADLHVYDSGVELGYAGKLTLANLQTTAPPPGQYYAAAEGYIRLGSSPAGTITMSGASAGHALTSHPAVLITAALTMAGFNAGDAKDMLDSNSFTAFADKRERGLYLTQATNISTIIDTLVAPLGWWQFTGPGKLLFGTLVDPAGLSHIYTVNGATNSKKISFAKTQDTPGGVPAASVSCRIARNYAVQTDVAGSVSADRKAWLGQEWRTDSLAAVAPHPLSVDLSFDTALTEAAPEIMTLLQALHTVPRELVLVDIGKKDFPVASTLLPGNLIGVNLQGRFDYSDQTMLLIAITSNQRTEAVSLVLWG